MRHPAEGVLRRLVDEPAGVGDADREHVTSCTPCLSALARMRDDASRVAAALCPSAAQVDVDAGWQRLSAAGSTGSRRVTVRHHTGPVALLRRPAAAAVAAAVVLAGAGTAAANDWLPIFSTEQVAPVQLGPDDLVALPDLTAYGELDLITEPDLREVEGAEEAAELTGLDVPQVATLPAGVVGEPVWSVGDQATGSFTFSTARAAQAATEAGDRLPPVPTGLDGSTVRLVAGPGVAQVWSSASGMPALLVGRAVAPRAFSTGVPFEVLRDYLLSLPGLPDDVAAQLRTFAADGTTLPLPVPTDEVRTSAARVDGAPATVLQTRDRALAAVVWVEDGIVTVVAGSLDDEELLAVAEDLG